MADHLIDDGKASKVDYQRATFFEYLFVMMLILYAGRGNTFFESGSFIDNPVGVSLPIMLSVILAIKWRITFNKQFYLLILCFFIYFIAITFKYGEFRPTIFLIYVILFFVVYSAVKALNFSLFIIYERLLFILTILGLFMWGIQIVMGGDTLFNFISRIPSIDEFSFVSSSGLNIIIYSVQPTSSSLLYGIMIPRNCGFAWEPGAFAVYLCLAIFINLFITSSDKNSKKRFWVFAVALLSTQSTTGYIISLIIFFYYFLNKNKDVLILLFPLVVIALAYIFSLPFMGNKIIEVINQTGEVETIVENSIIRGSSYTPGRFASFVISFEDFLNNPIFGLGTVSEKSWINKIGARVSPISGIGNLLAQFGLIGFIFFIVYSLKSSFFFSKHFKYKGDFLLFFIIISISISYSVIVLPLLMSFWMYDLFA